MDERWPVLPLLGHGGAEKIALLYCRPFCFWGMKLIVVTINPDNPIVHRLPNGIDHLDLEPLVTRARNGD